MFNKLHEMSSETDPIWKLSRICARYSNNNDSKT